MTDSPYDQRLANEANAVDQCMKLGGVILKPQSQTTIGFSAPPTNVGVKQLEFNRRTT